MLVNNPAIRRGCSLMNSAEKHQIDHRSSSMRCHVLVWLSVSPKSSLLRSHLRGSKQMVHVLWCCRVMYFLRSCLLLLRGRIIVCIYIIGTYWSSNTDIKFRIEFKHTLCLLSCRRSQCLVQWRSQSRLRWPRSWLVGKFGTSFSKSWKRR